METVIPIVLSGGSGTRLWPISRKHYAKQHAPILGGFSPFQRTLERVRGVPFGEPIVVTSSDGRFMAADQAAAIGMSNLEMALEPEGRDTAAAIAVGAAIAKRRADDAVALVLPSDHLITDTAAFRAAVEAAAQVARDGFVVAIGLTPTRPATGFGYIHPAEATGDGALRIAAFEEKPEAMRAERLIDEGCLWNSGMFCFRTDVALELLSMHAPAVAEAAAAAVAEGDTDLGALRLGACFRNAPKISFDYAVMEKTDRAAVVPAEMGWSDIGDWHAVWELSEKDASGNALEGQAFLQDSKGCYVRSSDRLLCAIGVTDLAIVDTPDALLIAPRDRTQEVKGLVGALAAQGRSEADTPARVHRPWGWYQTMDLGDRFRVKRIQVAPGKKLSLQKHHHRAEHWVVVRGTAEVTRDSETLLVRENESVYLPLGCAHRLANPGMIPVEIIEVQTGAYLEEDDIVRFEDDFGRS